MGSRSTGSLATWFQSIWDEGQHEEGLKALGRGTHVFEVLLLQDGKEQAGRAVIVVRSHDVLSGG